MQTLSCISFRQPWPFLAMCVAHSASTEPVNKIGKLYTLFTHWNNEMRQPFELTQSECRLCVCRSFLEYADLKYCSILKNAVHGFRKTVNWPQNVCLSLNGLRIVPWLNISITIHGKHIFLNRGDIKLK